jgi:hypothetical protein
MAVIEPHFSRSRRRGKFQSLVADLRDLGREAVDDPKVLADLRKLSRYLGDVLFEAVADSPEVARRKRQGRIRSLEGELARLRKEGETVDAHVD